MAIVAGRTVMPSAKVGAGRLLPERVKAARDRFAYQMIHNLKKTNPRMAQSVQLQYERGGWEHGTDKRGRINQSGNVYYLNEYVNECIGDLGFDWGGLLNNAAQAVISTGTQYAGAAAQNKLNMQAADHAAKLATQQIAAQNKADALRAQNVNSEQYIAKQKAAQEAADAALYRESASDTASHVAMDTPPWLWGALGLATAAGVYVFLIKPKRGKKK